MAHQAQAEPVLTSATWKSPGDSPETCRQRRRRRMEMRRERPTWPTAPHSRRLRLTHNGDEEEDEDEGEHISLPLWRPFRNPMREFSLISVKGLLESSADGAVRVEEDFCQRAAGGFAGGEPLHFFAVYDGQATDFYKRLMHRVVAEELGRAGPESGDDITPGPQGRDWWNDQLLSALQRSFERMDRVALHACRSTVDTVENEGSVAATVVAVLTAEHIVVARGGGSSRAVLCSDGIPIPLSNDRRYNKPDDHQRPSDLERVSEVDGFAVHNDDTHDELRGYKVLDMNYIIGNNELRSSSRESEPEIFVIERSKAEDECLILASEALWEVMSDETACHVATTCLRDGHLTSVTPTSDHCFSTVLSDESRGDDDLTVCYADGVGAAALLCRLALGRGSGDTIGVVVVDLKEY